MIMPAAEFKAKCLSLLDRVHHRGEAITITTRDARLNRDVALTILPELFAADRQGISRTMCRATDIFSWIRCWSPPARNRRSLSC